MAGINSDIEYGKLISGTITGASQTVEFSNGNNQTEAVQITGTWSGTLAFEATVDGTNWFSVNTLDQSTRALVTLTTVNGNFLIASQGFSATRVRASAWTSGTATINNMGADAVGVVYGAQAGDWLVTANQGLPNTTANRWPVQLTDGTDLVNVSPNNDLQTTDVLTVSALDGAVALTTSPVAVRVGGANLANRKYVIIEGLSTNIKWGFSNSTQTFDIFKDQILMVPVGPGVTIWAKVTASTGLIGVGELA